MVALTFFRTEIFGSRICFFHEKKGDQEFKYTEFTLGSTLGSRGRVVKALDILCTRD